MPAVTVTPIGVVIRGYAVVVVLLSNGGYCSCGLDLGMLMTQMVVVLLLVMSRLLVNP